MKVVAAILSSAVAVGQSLCGSFPSIKNFISFQSNLTTLEKKMENLVDLKNKVIEDVDFSSDAEMARWLREVEQILLEVNSVPTGITAHNGKLCGCFLNCSERYRLSKETARMLKEIERLLKAGDIAVKMVGRNYLAKAVEHILRPSIVNQTTASQNLAKVMDLLNDDEVMRIGVWGMGGVGKTTLVKNLNNQLKGSSSTHQFGIVIWATVSQNLDLKKVQMQLAGRLNLKASMEESVEGLAIQLHQNNCSGLNQMLETLVIRSIGSYTGLKSLTITRSSSSLRPDGGCTAHDDLLPNLEELRLYELTKLGNISRLVGLLGLRFSRLKSIYVFRCDGLEYLLTCGDFIISLPKLEAIQVSSCKSLVEIFNFPSQENFVPEPVVPNLRTLKLVNLPRLKTLYGQDGSGLHSKLIACVYHMKAIEQVEVIKCDNLRKLPLTIRNANTMKEIRGNAQWWDQLELEAHNTKSSLERFFNGE